MCELQFIKRYNSNLKEKDIIEFIKMLQFGSLANDDAFGLFNSKFLFKNKGTPTFRKVNLNILKEDSFIIGHNRLKTTGSNDLNYNNHPFTKESFIIAHNGIIHNYEELKEKYNLKHKIETDSFIILYLINHFFRRSNKATREKKIISAIAKTCNRLDGSISVFLLDNLTKNIYYFKNDDTYFNFYEINKEVLIGTTSSQKIPFIYLDGNFRKLKRVKKEIENNKIYLINNEHILKAVGNFRTKESYSNIHYTDNRIFNQIEEGEFYNKPDDRESYVREIDAVFYDFLGYIPNYRFNLKNKTLILYDDYSLKEINQAFGKIINVDMENKEVYINYDDLFNCAYTTEIIK